MNLTPLFKQYLQLKEKVKDAILLFRVGDFYETYFEDAKIFSEINSVVLTKRTLPDGKTIPMAGVPFHSVDNYIRNLLNAGYKVAIAEQLEEASASKGLVKRDIVEIITPGTITSYNYLNEKAFNFLVVVDYINGVYQVLAVDISVLDGYIAIANDREVINIISYFSPSEIVFSRRVDDRLKKQIVDIRWIVVQDNEYSLEELKRYTLDENSFFLLENNSFLDVFSLMIAYLKKSVLISSENTLRFRFRTFSGDLILLDSSTLKNLEIVGGKNSLVEVLDYTSTTFGARKFKIFITQPLRNVQKINQRLDVVDFLVQNTHYIINLREKIKKIPDVSRMLSKFSLYKYNLKDFILFKRFFIYLEDFIRELSLIEDPPTLLEEIRSNIGKAFDSLCNLKEVILRGIDDEIVTFEQVELIVKPGFNEQMDSYIYLLKNNADWIKEYENELRSQTGIKSIKVSYNQIFGYYIEVSKANLSAVPSYFERKQTLVNAERFVTPELKEFEVKLKEAVSSVQQLQKEILLQIISLVNQSRLFILDLVENLSVLDVFLSFAYCAVVNNYTRPTITEGKILILKEARHPIYEKFFEKFVPNNLYMDDEKFFIILTGPNMGGKSTFLKTVAMNVLLAQVGSFVPCSQAIIGIVDGIYTRIGSSDDIIKHRSTFMVEMLETAYILDNCSEKSLVVMDEIGRGTSTYDGMAIAWAVSQYLSTVVKCRTILATHFHQLSNLEKFIHSIANYNVEVLELEDRVEFTYKVIKGAAQKSYGIFVAQLAGVKPEVINIANQVLENFEKLTGIKKVQTKLIK
ncbi:MAG: DNA mismatch repair protein MutS [Candidatus Calescibacterium sp.]|nr:DNA mismatch repair protein MutS [Candidatus Calescibacterium sp.]MCX7972680.1 DNA mismatch repair protein MutS [bacterium]MDW8194723.1 DNA mismatch repair protein MutS [Candidatus Calescibacterium sp.]